MSDRLALPSTDTEARRTRGLDAAAELFAAAWADQLRGFGHELVRDARASLLAAPHRYQHLGPLPVSGSILEGLLNLRLAITHDSLNPLEVGKERAGAAAAAVVILDALERARTDELDSLGDEAQLRYATLRFLHPPPPFTGAPLEIPSPRTLGSLVARWELHRALPEPFVPWLARKAKQHAQFYRIGLLAPLYALRTSRVGRLLPRDIAQNPVAIETFAALEQLGPVLDNFVFDQGIRACFLDAVAIADLAFLYMQLADELVDNLVKLGGNEGFRRLLDAHVARDASPTCFVPLENLAREDLAMAGVDQESVIVKYDIRVSTLVSWLTDLRKVLLAAIERARIEGLRGEVSAFFRHCFATFLDELELPRLTQSKRLDTLPYAEVAWHFHRKNHEVMTRWLAIRARILGISPSALAHVISPWGVLLSSFQIFDDMKDVAVDLGHQPNYAIELASRSYPAELQFLEQSFGTRAHSLDRNDVAQLNVMMAATIRDCLRYSRLLALSSYDWFLDYVSDYRWRRNWLVRARSFHRVPEAPEGDVSIESGPLADFATIATGTPVIDAIFRFIAQVLPRLDDGQVALGAVAFVIDAVSYDHHNAIERALFPNIALMYRFANLRMRLSDEDKAQILVRIVKRHRRASERGLATLRAITDSSDFVFRVARALELPVAARALSAQLDSARPPSAT